MKKAAINALLFGAIVCCICSLLTGIFSIPLICLPLGLSFGAVVSSICCSLFTVVLLVWLPFGLLFGILFFLFELLYMRAYKADLQTAAPEERKFYRNKIKINSIISLGLLFQLGFFIFAICSICCSDDYAWALFVYSAIFALLAYALYFSSAITESILFKYKRYRYIIKAAVILVIGGVGLVTFGYGLAGSIVWCILSFIVFAFETISLFWAGKPRLSPCNKTDNPLEGNAMTPQDFTTMLDLAKQEIASSELDGDFQVIVIEYASGAFESFALPYTEKVAGEEVIHTMKSNSSLEIKSLVCMWASGELDLPSFALRASLCTLCEGNLSAKILLQGDSSLIIKELGDTLK